jgi:hypothetical protein
LRVFVRDNDVDQALGSTNESLYATWEAAEKAGLAIKKEHPILQVAVHDGIESVKKIIELP